MGSRGLRSPSGAPRQASVGEAEGAVAASEQHVRLALEATDTGMWTWDLRTDAVEWSPECYVIHGLAEGEFAGTGVAFFGLVHSDDRERVEATVRAAVAGQSRYECEFRIGRPSGEVAWVGNRGRAVYVEGVPTRMLGIITDITGRKQADETLQRYRLLSEHSRDILLFVRPTDGRIVEANAAAAQAYGYTREELLTLTITDLRPADTLSELLGQMATADVAGATFETVHQRRDGTRFPVEVSSRGADVAGARLLLGIVRDITGRKRAEAELSAGDERLRLAAQAAGVGFWEWHLPTNQVRWTAEMFRIYGVAPTKDGMVTYSTWIAAVLPEELAEQQAILKDTIRRGGRGTRAFRIRRASDGAERYVEAVETVRLNATGAPEWVVGTTIDVTERRRVELEARAAEQALAASEERFRIMADGLPFPVWVHYPDGRLRFVNRTYCEYFDVTAEEVFGENWQPLVHPDDASEYIKSFLAAVERRVPWSAQCRVRRGGDSEWRWIESSARPHYSSDGTYLGMVGCSPDITDRKVAAAELARRERELQTLADNIPDVLTRFDRELRHVFANAAVEKATGRPPSEFLGRTNRELGMPAALCDQWDPVLRAVFETGQEQSIAFTFASEEGARYYSARFVPEFGADGQVEYALGVTHDVTEMKRYEQMMREQGKRKDEFLATLAHELRNPLAPIRNGLQLLRMSGEVTPAVAKTRDMMERQVGHLVHLVDDLLDIARVSQDKITLRKERLTVREVVEAAVEACRPSIDAKRHTLAIDMPPEGLALYGDRTRLVQILSNLLTNAAKYGEDGGHITLAVRTEGNNVIVRVTDTGIGIAPELLPTLWDMFTQVRDTIDKAQGGLGIGLSLVKKLVEMHGGSVAAESRGVGHGSTFTIRLPLASAELQTSDVPAVAAPRDNTPSSTAAGCRILVVDDNEDGAEAMAMMLDVLGHQAKIALTGHEAVEAARQFRPDLVFCDIGLPEMDGYEVARRLRAEPDTAGGLLVALTGWGTEDDKRRSKAAGFDLHLTKPVELAAVQNVLARLASRTTAP